MGRPPSIKGALDIDWKDNEERAELITRLGEKAVEMVEAYAPDSKRSAAASARSF